MVRAFSPCGGFGSGTQGDALGGYGDTPLALRANRSFATLRMTTVIGAPVV